MSSRFLAVSVRFWAEVILAGVISHLLGRLFAWIAYSFPLGLF